MAWTSNMNAVATLLALAAASLLLPGKVAAAESAVPVDGAASAPPVEPGKPAVLEPPAHLQVRVEPSAAPVRVDLSETFQCVNTHQVGVAEIPSSLEKYAGVSVHLDKNVETLVTLRSHSCALTVGFIPRSNVDYVLDYGVDSKGCWAGLREWNSTRTYLNKVESVYKRSSTCKR